VQRAACEALRHIAAGSDTRTRAVVDAGALRPIVAAVRAHALSAGMQAQGCLALHAIASDSDLRQLVASADPLPLVEAALRAQAGDATLQAWGRQLARRLRWAGGPPAGELVEVDRIGAKSGARQRRETERPDCAPRARRSARLAPSLLLPAARPSGKPRRATLCRHARARWPHPRAVRIPVSCAALSPQVC
jgi:hypothetical protein